MLKINKYDSEKDLLTVTCICGEVFSSDLSTVNELNFLEEFGEYENLQIPCGKCNLLHCLNMNIPIDDYSEIELEEMVMPFYDIQNRKVLRDVIWDKRQDLIGQDRLEFNKQYIHYLDEWKAKKQEMIQFIQKQQ